MLGLTTTIHLRPAREDDAARIAKVLLSSRQAFLPYAVSSHSDEHGFRAIAFTDGSTNDERCPDVLNELADRSG